MRVEITFLYQKYKLLNTYGNFTQCIE